MPVHSLGSLQVLSEVYIVHFGKKETAKVFLEYLTEWVRVGVSKVVWVT